MVVKYFYGTFSSYLPSFFPLNNYYVELPGGAFDIKEVLTVDKKADDSKGSYNFVAVAQTKATLALMLYAQLNDFAKLQTAEEATGNYSDEDFMRINQILHGDFPKPSDLSGLDSGW